MSRGGEPKWEPTCAATERSRPASGHFKPAHPPAWCAQTGLTTHLKIDVGMAGFEPAASCSQSRRANQAALHPVPLTWMVRPNVDLVRSNCLELCQLLRGQGALIVEDHEIVRGSTIMIWSHYLLTSR